MRRIVRLLITMMLLLTVQSLFAYDFEVLQRQSDFVKIWHDDAGTPHVVASSTYGAYFGYGYCLGRDRMFQLELLRKSTEGTLSEVFGKDYIEVDYMARRDAVPFAELEAGLAKCSMKFKTALSGFTDGINRAIEECRKNRFRQDPAFEKAGITPSPFSEIQILNIFAGTMAARYNDFSQELDNQHFLTSLVKKFGARTASNIFEDVVFYEDPKVYTTLGEVPYFKPGFRFPTRTSPHGFYTEPLYSPTLRNRKRNEELRKLGIPDKSGSYAVVLSNLYKGEKKAWILGGPQMGYFKPSAVYSIGLHTPEFDIVGTTPVGYIMIMFGANRFIGFTATAGVGNLVDIIALRQDPADDKNLLGENFSCTKQTRLEQIYVKGQKAPVLREVYETDLGPVIAIEGDTWYVKNRGWRGFVVSSYEGWFDSTFAPDLDKWFAASDRNALSINWLGADRQGNIGYVHCGMGKSRKSFGDDRLPVSSPTVFPAPDFRLAGRNPATGFYVNWNCPPVKGYRNGDLQSGWAADQRTKYIADHVNINHNSWSVDYLIQLDKDIAFTDLRAYFFKDLLIKFIDSSMFTPVQQRAMEALVDWNNLRTDNDEDGKFDHPGAGVFDQFFNDLYGALIGNTLGDFAWMAASDPTWTQSALLARAILGDSFHDYLGGKSARDFVTGVFVSSVDKLTRDGLTLPEFDCPPMKFAGVNHVGAPTLNGEAVCSPFMNRGSDIQIMELSPEGIKVFGCMPPGNSSFGKFATNQMKDFKNFVFKPRALTMKEVRNLNGRFMVVKPQAQ
ncbi:MAG: penicillin acylase family protein [Candidatus Rifleibacteriota bacterium]